jgi:predicted Zn-dependent protease
MCLNPSCRLSRRWMLGGLAAVGLAGCSDNPATGRKQLIVVSDEQLVDLADQTWAQLSAEAPRLGDPAADARVTRVGSQIAEASGLTKLDWDFVVLDTPDENAFVLPNGKVAVFRGLLQTIRSDDELAAVLGHEAGHVLLRHPAERVSQQLAVEAGVGLARVLLSDGSGEGADRIAGALGMGAVYGVILPYSRKHELEADSEGVKLMREAGYDPQAALRFWERRIAEGGGRGQPEIISTHPGDRTRLTALRKAVAAV